MNNKEFLLSTIDIEIANMDLAGTLSFGVSAALSLAALPVGVGALVLAANHSLSSIIPPIGYGVLFVVVMAVFLIGHTWWMFNKIVKWFQFIRIEVFYTSTESLVHLNEDKMRKIVELFKKVKSSSTIWSDFECYDCKFRLFITPPKTN